MPVSRRKSDIAALNVQPTLSFNTRLSSNRITKPSLTFTTRSSPKTSADETAKALKLSKESGDSSVIESTKREVEVQREPKVVEVAVQTPAPKPVTDTGAEEKAALISDIQIKKYWKAKEDERQTPRVHQQGLALNDKILREFDLSSQYGPCVGIARTHRWKRAARLGLKPPVEVLAVLLKEDSKNNTKSQRAHVDELLSSKFAVDGET